MGKDCELTKKACELLGFDEETDPEVQAEFDFLDKLKSKYTEQQVYDGLMEEDIDFELSNLKNGGANTLEGKDLLTKLRAAKAHKDFPMKTKK